MDFFSISAFISVFAFFVFLWVFFFYRRNNDQHDNLGLLSLSSFSMFISLLAFHFEFRLLVSNFKYTYILSFISFSSMLFSITIIAVTVSMLYGEKPVISKNFLASYSIISGIAYALNTVYGSYVLGFLILTLLMIAPGYCLFKALLGSSVDLKYNPFIFQIVMLSTFYLLKMITLINNPTTSPTNPNANDTIYSMFILITLIMFSITYLLESNHILNKRLLKDSSILSNSLQKAKQESERDDLTSLVNRGKIDELLKKNFSLHLDGSMEFSVAMIDVNNFKAVNDSHGHLFGDEVLKGIAQNLQRSVRNQDIVGRFGGDEFLVIFTNTKIEHMDVLKTNLLKGFGSIKLPLENYDLSISIGVSNSVECTTIESLIDLADQRMYSSKDAKKTT